MVALLLTTIDDGGDVFGGDRAALMPHLNLRVAQLVGGLVLVQGAEQTTGSTEHTKNVPYVENDQGLPPSGCPICTLQTTSLATCVVACCWLDFGFWRGRVSLGF
jgi:hypothetical protein